MVRFHSLALRDYLALVGSKHMNDGNLGKTPSHWWICKWTKQADCKSVPEGSVVRIRPPPPFFYVRMGYSQAVRQQTLTLSFPWFESRYPSQEDPLAQPVEHLTFNQRVRRSNRLRVTITCGRGGTGRRTRLRI